MTPFAEMDPGLILLIPGLIVLALSYLIPGLALPVLALDHLCMGPYPTTLGTPHPGTLLLVSATPSAHRGHGQE